MAGQRAPAREHDRPARGAVERRRDRARRFSRRRARHAIANGDPRRQRRRSAARCAQRALAQGAGRSVRARASGARARLDGRQSVGSRTPARRLARHAYRQDEEVRAEPAEESLAYDVESAPSSVHLAFILRPEWYSEHVMVPDEVMAARMKRWLADLRRKIAALEAHQMELAAIQERTPDVDNEKQLARGDEALRDA